MQGRWLYKTELKQGLYNYAPQCILYFLAVGGGFFFSFFRSLCVSFQQEERDDAMRAGMKRRRRQNRPPLYLSTLKSSVSCTTLSVTHIPSLLVNHSAQILRQTKLTERERRERGREGEHIQMDEQVIFLSCMRDGDSLFGFFLNNVDKDLFHFSSIGFSFFLSFLPFPFLFFCASEGSVFDDFWVRFFH